MVEEQTPEVKRTGLSKLSYWAFNHPNPLVHKTYCVLFLVPVAFFYLFGTELWRWLRNCGAEIDSCFVEVFEWTCDSVVTFWDRMYMTIRISWCRPSKREELAEQLRNR